MTLIAVTGGTGFVGQSLLDTARVQDVDVNALARRPQEPRDGVEWIKGELADHASLARLVRRAEAVIHVAGVVNAPDPAGFEAGNVAGTLALVEAAVAAGVPRFIHVSSLAAREPGLSTYGASKARAERIVMASGLDWTIVRPPAIYGPRDTEMFELFRMARWGVMAMPPRVGRTSMLHVDDLSRLLLALVPGGEDVTHKVFEPDDGRSGGWTHGELARAVGWAMGRRPVVMHLPESALRLAARADGFVRGKKAKLTADRVGYMSHPDWVSDPAVAVPPDLWLPEIPTREGLKNTASWYWGESWL